MKTTTTIARIPAITPRMAPIIAAVPLSPGDAELPTVVTKAGLDELIGEVLAYPGLFKVDCVDSAAVAGVLVASVVLGLSVIGALPVAVVGASVLFKASAVD